MNISFKILKNIQNFLSKKELNNKKKNNFIDLDNIQKMSN